MQLHARGVNRAQGEPFSVRVDDWIPTIGGVPIGVTSSNAKEIWPLMLEKACAKAIGSYAAMTEPSSDTRARDSYVRKLLQLDSERESMHEDHKDAEEEILQHMFETLWDSGIPARSNPWSLLPISSAQSLRQSEQCDADSGTAQGHALKGGASLVRKIRGEEMRGFGMRRRSRCTRFATSR